jgi:hypothetical protein
MVQSGAVKTAREAKAKLDGDSVGVVGPWITAIKAGGD